MEQEKQRFEVHIDCPAEGGPAIECLLQGTSQLSKSALKKAMQYGAVWCTRGGTTSRIRRAKKALQAGDQLHLYYDADIIHGSVVPAGLVADEGDYSIWDKPCGMFSQGSKWGDHTAITRWVEMVGLPDRQSFLVHRLDRATRGLIMVAHSKTATQQLTALFETRAIDKRYRAKVRGHFPENLTLIEEPLDQRAAKTGILKVDYDLQSDESVVSLKLETGRKHQIRRHLANVGFPIIGDRLYGNASEEKMPSDLQLKSCYLAFKCPLSGAVREYTL